MYLSSFFSFFSSEPNEQVQWGLRLLFQLPLPLLLLLHQVDGRVSLIDGNQHLSTVAAQAQPLLDVFPMATSRPSRAEVKVQCDLAA